MIIDKLKQIYVNLLENIDLHFKRYFYNRLNENQVIAIVWERWIWKTYTLLQYLKENPSNSFYLSADNPLIVNLFETISKLVLDYKIKTVIIDEIHKFPQWQTHLKSIIDSFPHIKLIVSGSSSLEIYKWTSALARRILNLYVYPLNFKEFLKYNYNIDIPEITFDELIHNYKEISFQLSTKFEFKYFKEYLQYWFYPFFKNNIKNFTYFLINNVKKIILEDLPTFLNIRSENIFKLEKLFFFIANIPPSDLNYSNLAKKIGISKDLLENIIFYLDKVWIINLALRTNKISDVLRKEFKIFLWNPNLYYCFSSTPQLGTIRESFVLHFLKRISNSLIFPTNIILPRYWDFMINIKGKTYLFEIWWKNKKKKQIKNVKNSFIVKDDILIWEDNIIPMWLFGLLKE